MALDMDSPPRCEEPEESGGEEEGGGFMAVDLLARARLLCEAANQISLPVLQAAKNLSSGAPTSTKSDKKSTNRKSTDKDKRRDARSPKLQTPPRKLRASAGKDRPLAEQAEPDSASSLLPRLGVPPKHVPPTKLPTLIKRRLDGAGTAGLPPAKPPSRSREEDDEATLPLPQIHATDEWRRQREAEKVRQAQERAKARVLKSKPSNQASETAAGAELEDPLRRREEERCKERQLEEGRRKAEERIRQHRLLETQQQQQQREKEIAEKPPSRQTDEERARLDSFHRQTLQRLHASKKVAAESTNETRESQQRAAATEPLNEDAEMERKKLECRRRKETAARLRRIQQQADEQKRLEQERLEQDIAAFKSKRRELDRVAKGLKKESLNTTDVESTTVAIKSLDGPSPSPTISHVPCETRGTSCAKQEERATDKAPNEDHAADDIAAEMLYVTEPQESEPQSECPTSATSTNDTKRKKLPPWKQTPVPVLPTECYSHKAVLSPNLLLIQQNFLPGDHTSYAQKYRLRSR